jgi:hypothetical protein
MTMQDLQREGYWPSNSIPTLPVTSGLEFYLDASVAASVDVANQLWKNLVSSPASGAAQTDYDFQMGDDTTSGGSDEPLHVGTPTSGHPFAYWNMGGDDFFRIPSETTFTKSLQKQLSAYSFVFIVNLPSKRGELFATGFFNSDPGIKIDSDSSRNARFEVFNGSGSAITSVTADNTWAENQDAMNAISIDEDGGDVCFFYKNGDYIQVSGSDTFDPDFSVTADAGVQTQIGGRDNIRSIGTKYYAVIAYNRALTKSEMDQLYRHFKAQGRV